MTAEELAYHGEDIRIAERLVVAPSWGRLRAHPLEAGQPLARGTVIGLLLDGEQEVPVVCHESAFFLEWLAKEGERVSPGRRLATLRVADG